MKTLLVLCAVLFAHTSFASTAFNIKESQQRCQTHYKDSKVLYSNVFSWGMTHESMQAKFDEVYSSEQRLDLHANYDKNTDSFYIYKDQSGGIKPLKITPNFIKSVTRQIEIALENGYAEFVFFPDMGHSHLYFPEKHWDENYETSKYPPTQMHKLYEKMLSDPQLHPLYHLSEQLKSLDENKNLLEDPHIQFRYWNRNFVGKNDTSDYNKIYVDKDNAYNTVRGIDGYKLYSAGYAVSASKKGCFPYIDRDGSTKYFDISLKDPEPDPSGYSDDDFYGL